MHQDVVIGVDIGTSACKAIAIDSEGRMLTQSQAMYSPTSPRPGWFELDPNTFVDAFTTVIHDILKKVPANRVEGIGLDGISNSPILIDEKMKPLRPCILWMDGRGVEYIPLILRSLDVEGITPTLPVTPLITLVKLLWIKENESEVWSSTRYVLQPKDYVRMWLTNTVATDPSDASVTMMFDSKTFGWADYVERVFGIELRKLPEIVTSYKIIGYTTENIAKQTGLPEGIPVTIGCADGVADVLAAGLSRESDSLIRLGTAGVFSLILDRYIPDGKRYYIFAHVEPGRWVIQRMFPFGIPHRWFLKTFYNRELEYAESKGLDPYAYIENMLLTDIERVENEMEELVFIPNIKLFEDPASFLGVFAGIGSMHTKIHLMLALLQGLACATRETVDIVSQKLGLAIDRIRLVGGGSKSTLIRRMIASLLNARVETVKYHDASIGAAILSTVGIGMHRSFEEAINNFIVLDQTVEPDEHLQASLPKVYEKYLRFRRALNTHVL
ncbi:MAG: FGGY family carbohydrate kinase [Ignisphaera sp.]|uniref:Xylulokinase n=1 Tax=Ignisphaera aggregans TaxID=334771 RepID=A0A7J3JNN6_9CREN